MRKSTFTKLQKQFCALLAKERKEAGMTQRQVAKKLGVYPAYVSKYETGERRLDVIEFLAVAQVIGFDPKALVAALEETQK